MAFTFFKPQSRHLQEELLWYIIAYGWCHKGGWIQGHLSSDEEKKKGDKVKVGIKDKWVYEIMLCGSTW